MKSLLLLVSLLSVGLSVSDDIFSNEVERGNDFIDKLLKDMMEENGHEYDPYVLEDNQASFSKKILFVNYTGEAKLHNGYITGLRSLHRPDNCVVEEKDGKLLVRADLGAGVLNFHYDGTVKFMNFGPTISVHGELAYLETHMEFSVDARTGRDGELQKFSIDEIKGMDISITGLGPMNWAMNYLANWIASLFNGYVKRLIESTARNYLKDRLPNYQFPVEEPQPEPETPEPQPEPETPEPQPEPETPEPQPEPETPEPQPEPETPEPQPETPEPQPEPETPEPQPEPENPEP